MAPRRRSPCRDGSASRWSLSFQDSGGELRGGAGVRRRGRRLLGFFAQQDLLPDSICLTRSAAGIAMRIAEATLDDHRARVILARMQALPDVASARLTLGEPTTAQGGS